MEEYSTKKDIVSMEINGIDLETEKDPKAQQKNGITAELYKKYHDKASALLEQRKKEVKIFKHMLFLGLLSGHFIWATVYFFNQSEIDLDSSMCSGYGFLLILNIFIYFGLLYYFVIKPHILPSTTRVLDKHLGLYITKRTKIIFCIVALIAIAAYIIYESSDDFSKLTPVLGLVIFFIIGFVFSKHPSQVDWNPVLWGLLLQFTFGLMTLKWDVGRNVFECIGNKTTTFLGYSKVGAAFVYSDYLVTELGVFVFNALSSIYLICLSINVLYHYGIMQKVIIVLGEFLASIMGTTISESVNSAANIFLGMTDAPFLLKPYLNKVTDSEIHSIMAAGFASVSGTVLAGYISFGAKASHLITASVMSAPAALCYSKLLYPETKATVVTKESISLTKLEYSSALDAASQGAVFANQVVLGVTANLIAFISVVYFFNGIIMWLGELVGYTGADAWSIEIIVGYIFMPVAYIMGVPWKECESVGQLIGIKTIINEFAAFKAFGEMTDLSERTKIIATYAICGFSNPASMGIMISTFSVLIPEKRDVILETMFRAFMTGLIVCLMTACVAALLLSENDVKIS